MRKQNIRPKDDVSHKMRTVYVCQVAINSQGWNPKLYYPRGYPPLTFLNSTENWNQYQTHYTIPAIVPTATRGANSTISICYNSVYMPPTKIVFLCTSFALQIKQTPILAGAIILDTMKKTNTHAWLLGSKSEKPRKEYPVANRQQQNTED